MTHYVLLKLAAGTDADAVERRVKKTYKELEETLPYLKSPVVYRSCIERDSNADIMIRVQLDNPEQLQSYLTHPLHVQMGKDLNDVIVGRTSFDYM